MIVVNLYGGPGAGKSTAAAYIFSHLKMAGVNCELVPEYAKQAVWEDRKQVFADRYYLLAKQYHMLHILQDSVDVAITDSPLMLNTIYGADYPDCFHQMVNHLDTQFPTLNYFIQRMHPYSHIGRLQSEHESDGIADRLLDKLGDIPVVPGTQAGYARIGKEVLKKVRQSRPPTMASAILTSEKPEMAESF